MLDTSEAIHPNKSGPVVIQEAWNTPGALKSWRQEGEVFYLEGERARLVLVFLNEHTFRLKLYHSGVPGLSTTPAVLPQITDKVSIIVRNQEDQLIMDTGSLQVHIVKSDLSWMVDDREGKRIARQNLISWNPRGLSNAVYDMPAQSHFYGLGEKASFLDKRGERYTNWNTDVFAPHMPEIEALYESIPLLIHMQEGGSCYGIFLDNPGRTDFDMRSHSGAYSIACHTGEYDIYFIGGPDMKDVVSRYTALTGRISLPPKWAIGYHQSRYSYMNQHEVLELARTFREKQIPCDVIYLDIHYMNEYRVFTFDPVRFPDPEGMMAELKELGMRIVPIVDPGVKKDPQYPVYREGVQQGHFCRKLEGDIFYGEVWPGISAFPDFTEPNTAKWWGDLHTFYTKLGIRGIWNDMNEPAVFNESKTMDLDVIHGNDGQPKTHEEMHNLYGMLMSKATFEGLRRQTGNERPFVLTRAGYAGVQRYAAVWTGDNRSFWEHMALAIPMVLNMGLSGIPFAGPDIGGFAHHTSAQLLVRWTQMGVFFPYCRNHSALDTMRQEPWSFGEEVEGILRFYIGLRYRWMPHLYNLFHEAAETGLPIMRPLILEYPADRHVTNLSDQFLLGRDVLIAPVYRPDSEYRSVYLPEGIWIDYWTGEEHPGGQHILACAPLERMPMYIRSGAVIAEGALRQYAEEPLLPVKDALTFHLYGAKAENGFQADASLYEDDGVSYNHEQGQYSQLAVRIAGREEGIELAYDYQVRTYAAERNHLRFVLHQPGFEPSRIEGLERLNAKQLAAGREGWYVEAESGSVIMQVQDGMEGASWLILR
ncbi:glycoside hydrolase family 31 protein [Paenibacillus sp. JX-17]|uniref:Glycoside hydrolase family 31 protein n=1 Tax=Paenibacillus lacisoli TaxID=3064525 RepID=A0ABT9CCR6_9BACL|nr:TIM-barrel domain-containing protein [Paenibacillus sp. JX-17]MDO7906670.1 glycoside hydrolase family 31 protein [Paenibacillus sp. JX-17]